MGLDMNPGSAVISGQIFMNHFLRYMMYAIRYMNRENEIPCSREAFTGEASGAKTA